MKEAIQRNPNINKIIKRAISEAVAEAIQAGYRQAVQRPKDIYKATERRLYAYPDLKDKIKTDREYLKNIHALGLDRQSTDIVRFKKSGVRLSDEEIKDAIILDYQAKIAAAEREIKLIDDALTPLTSDPYYLTISGRYFENLQDDIIANKLHCDSSTVRRNRGRLVHRIAVRLFGVEAL